jgi:pimeloyl-ACP methyl ester carboxylesterase
VNAAGPTSRVYFSQRLRLHYVDWGNPSAPPLLLLHGGRDHCRNWDWVAAALRDEYHIIAPDLRGHGDSAWSASGHYTMASYIYDLTQLIHQQELAPVSIVAHSLGGNIASRYAGIYPDAVRRLVVIEGIGPPPRPPDAKPSRPIDQRMRDWIDEQRSLSGRLPRRYASIEDALRRMQEENPHLSAEQARHLTQHGVNQNEDGTYSWKFDNYVRVWPPYDTRGDRVAVVGYRVPDSAGLWQGELGEGPGGGRPRRLFPQCAGSGRGRRGALGTPRPSGPVPARGTRFSDLNGRDGCGDP